jgi:hypothetical protein
MADPTFDPLAYVRNAPVITLESGILLAQTLVAVMPKGAPAHVKKAAAKLGRVAAAAEKALGRRQAELAERPGETSRDVDIAADQVWSALYDILAALARLPEKYERAKKARALLPVIFPEGTGFLRLPYAEQVVRMGVALRRIDDLGLAKAVGEAAGPELLQEIRLVQSRYEVMVARRLTEPGPADSLLDHVRSLQRAILEYATAVVGTVDGDDPDTIAPAREALRPIDNHREQLAAGRRPEPSSPDVPAPVAPSAEPGAASESDPGRSG